MSGCHPLRSRDVGDDVTVAQPERGDIGSVVHSSDEADLDQVPAVRQLIHCVTERVSRRPQRERGAGEGRVGSGRSRVVPGMRVAAQVRSTTTRAPSLKRGLWVPTGARRRD